jgi:hypothetical protein
MRPEEFGFGPAGVELLDLITLRFQSEKHQPGNGDIIIYNVNKGAVYDRLPHIPLVNPPHPPAAWIWG